MLGNIIKTVAKRCCILQLKCTELGYGWSSGPDPAAGAHSALPDPKLDLRGVLLRVGTGRRKGE